MTTFATFCTSSNEWYDAPCGDACVAYVASAPCSIFDGEEPQACAVATGPIAGPPPPPPPPTCTPLSQGTTSGTITTADPLYDGSHARAYCISFAAGQLVTILTAPPLSGVAIPDTQLYLINPSGSVIAFNDDFGGLYSRIALTIPVSGEYRIVVNGFSILDVGNYQLTVTAN